MSEKYQEATSYTPDIAHACEIALVRLLRAFSMYRPHLRLVGGLTPRYLTPAAPPHVPAHVGTTDVDIVLNISVLVHGGHYNSLRKQLKNAGFSRHVNAVGKASAWQWECRVDGRTIVVEFLQHTDEAAGGKLAAVEGEQVSACLIPHVGIVEDWYSETTVMVELEDGVSQEIIRHADVISFIVLKSLAYDDRAERKDAADLLHVIMYWEKGLDNLVELFAERLQSGKHQAALNTALAALGRRFCSDGKTKGADKDGPGAYVNFHGMSGSGEQEMLERRNVSGMIEYLLTGIQEKSGNSYWAIP